MALKKYDQETVDKIITSIDSELGDSWNYGSDDLSFLRREYIDRFFRLDYGNEEEGYSKYHSPLIQNHVLQTRAYLMRPFNKSKMPIVKFATQASTLYLDHLVRYELKIKKKLMDLAFNGALLKTLAVKIGVKPTLVVEQDYAVFEGESKEEIEDEIDLFFSEDEDIEQIGDIEWEGLEGEIQAYEVPTPPPVNPVAPGAPQQPSALPPEAQETVDALVAGEPTEEEPVLEEEFQMWRGVVRFKKDRVENKPFVDVVPPYEFHISRQAPSQEEAAVVGRVTPMTLSELKIAYPDAPKHNGYKSKAEQEKFWEEVNGEWLGWTQQNEWYSMWLKDNSSYYEGYYFNVAQEADSPAHAYLVADVDIQLDPYKTGIAKWYNVLKVGHFILSCEEISQPSFLVGSLIPVGGRWLGLSIADLIWDEDVAVTNNMRANDNAILQSTYANPIVDQEQIMLEDVINRQPDSIIRRQLNAVPKQGVPALEQYQTQGPSAASFQVIDKYQEFAGTASGAGKFFQGHESDNISSSRVTADTASIIENNSDLMLDEHNSCFWDFVAEMLLLLHNACVLGKATPLSFEYNGEQMTIDPLEDLPLAKTADIELIVGSNEEKEKLEKAQAVLDALIAVENVPTLAALITPEGKAAALGDYFVSLGLPEDAIQAVLNPAGGNPMQSPEVQEQIAAIQQQEAKRADQAIQEYMQSEERAMKIELNAAQVDKTRAEAAALRLKPEDLALNHSRLFETLDQKEGVRKDKKQKDAAELGIAEDRLDLDKETADREYDLARTKDIRTQLG